MYGKDCQIKKLTKCIDNSKMGGPKGQNNGMVKMDKLPPTAMNSALFTAEV